MTSFWYLWLNYFVSLLVIEALKRCRRCRYREAKNCRVPSFASTCLACCRSPHLTSRRSRWTAPAAVPRSQRESRKRKVTKTTFLMSYLLRSEYSGRSFIFTKTILSSLTKSHLSQNLLVIVTLFVLCSLKDTVFHHTTGLCFRAVGQQNGDRSPLWCCSIHASRGHYWTISQGILLMPWGVFSQIIVKIVINLKTK